MAGTEHTLQDRADELTVAPCGFMVLMRQRYMVLRNMFRQLLDEQAIKIGGVLGALVLVWVGLYAVLAHVLAFVQRQQLEGIVATPLIFTFFFLALTGMLSFSNAILCYGSLFKRKESAYLAASPLKPRDVVYVKYFESLVLSSWSVVLLGLPLMMAIVHTSSQDTWLFYPVFLSLFMLFLPLPGALGLLLAWLVVMLFPKTPRRAMVFLVIAVASIAGWWGMRVFSVPATSRQWLDNFYDNITVLRHASMPHVWVANGIDYAIRDQMGKALFYAFVTFANAMFFSLIVVELVSRYFTVAYTRAQTHGSRNARRASWLLSWIGELVFAYLPARQRLLAGKDLKSFCRDPLQWSQMAILFGLLALYVSNAQRMWVDLGSANLQLLVSFLNSVAVSMILATFTSRFVFPLVSLEGQQFWLLGLLPLRRSTLVVSKFLYALTLTGFVAMLVVGTSVIRLDLARPLAISHLIAIAAVCIGLCGISIGMGARMPVLNERNPARIAGGFGGTVNLLISVGVVILSLTCLGIMSVQLTTRGLGDVWRLPMFIWPGLILLINISAAAISMTLGIRRFARLQW